MDLREGFVKNVSMAIVSLGIDPSKVKQIENIIFAEMSNFEISPRCTDLVVVDNTTESLFNMYFGSLLVEGKSEKTVKSYRSILTRFADEVGKPLLEVGSYDVKVWLARYSKIVSDTTLSNYKNYISAFYKWLYEEEFITKNPMAKVKTIKVQEKVRLAFTSNDVDSIRSSCKTLRERAEFEVMLSTGVRVDELCNIKIEDVDFVRKEIVIQKAKGNKQRIVHTNDVCISHLVKYINSRDDDCPYLLVSKLKDKMSTRSVEDEVRKIGDRAEVSNVHPHRFRRTFATSCYERGMDIRTIQLLLGHKNLNTTMKYLAESRTKVRHQYEMYAAS